MQALLAELPKIVSLRQVAGAALIGGALGLLVHTYRVPADAHLLVDHGGHILAVVLFGCGAFLLRAEVRRKVVIVFMGGFMDGKTLKGFPDHPAKEGVVDEAVRHYIITDGGTVGKRFMSASEFALNAFKTLGGNLPALQAASKDPQFQCGHYEIISRQENDHEVVIKAKYVGA
jgi:hypothetical protein